MNGVGFRASVLQPIVIVLALTAASTQAVAQRASENAVTAADDAFGTTVGNESIGLYSPNDVRGFSPSQAGNLRIEGLYFDSQGNLSQRLTRSNTVRVGLSAQSYPFPAPTGIADYRLRLPGGNRVVSAVANLGPFDTYGFEVDAQTPVIQDKLSIGFGVNGMRERRTEDAITKHFGGAFIAKWTPSENIEVIPFAGYSRRWRLEATPYYTPDGSFVPPLIPAGVFFTQHWADFEFNDSIFGLIGRARLPDNWSLQAGIFRSASDKPHGYWNIFQKTSLAGTAERVFVSYPHANPNSLSGEIRLERAFAEGPRRHTIQMMFRGRDAERTTGGTSVVSTGVVNIFQPEEIPKPAFALGPQTLDLARQGTVGLSYQGLWQGIGEMSVGLQKTFYGRDLHRPVGTTTLTTRDRDNPWLVNGTMAAYLSRSLVIYTGYTRGLEETSDAPTNAINRGATVPATRTSQIDGGLRYTITPRVRLMAGVFQVKKPFFNLDTQNFYTRLGNVRHRGVELSLSGEITDGLTVVAGTVLLQARRLADAGARPTGKVPLGTFPRVSRLNIQYTPPTWSSLSFDTQLENIASRVASADNVARLPARTTLNVGGRYRFEFAGNPAQLRVQALNVTNVAAWNMSSAGLFQLYEPRRFQASLLVDF